MGRIEGERFEMNEIQQPIIRVFEHCPKCRKYISPGFRTDMCPFCKEDFTHTREFQERLESDRNLIKLLSIGSIKRQMMKDNISMEEMGTANNPEEDCMSEVIKDQGKDEKKPPVIGGSL